MLNMLVSALVVDVRFDLQVTPLWPLRGSQRLHSSRATVMFPQSYLRLLNALCTVLRLEPKLCCMQSSIESISQLVLFIQHRDRQQQTKSMFVRSTQCLQA